MLNVNLHVNDEIDFEVHGVKDFPDTNALCIETKDFLKEVTLFMTDDRLHELYTVIETRLVERGRIPDQQRILNAELEGAV